MILALLSIPRSGIVCRYQSRSCWGLQGASRVSSTRPCTALSCPVVVEVLQQLPKITATMQLCLTCEYIGTHESFSRDSLVSLINQLNHCEIMGLQKARNTRETGKCLVPTNYTECQGYTSHTLQATSNAKESIEWGTNIVGGVTPGRTGEHLGLPVLPTVQRVRVPCQDQSRDEF